MGRLVTCDAKLSEWHRRRRIVGVGALVMALVAAGCSSSKPKAATATTATTASGTASTKSPTTAAAGGDIVIGGIVQSSQFPDTATGFQARITRANAEGGISGRMIKFIGAQDDNGTAATDQQIVQSLILNDHVVAIAPVTTVGLSPASTDFAAQNKTPMLGWSFLPNMCGNPWVYGFNGCLVGTKVLNSSLMDPVIAALGGDASKIRLAIQANSNQVGSSANGLYASILQKRGGTTVYNEQNMPASGTVDYTPYVQAILKSKANLVINGIIFSEAIAFAAALKAGGYTGAIQDFQTYFPGLLSQANVASALEGEYIDAQIPPQEAETPAVKQMEKDLVAIGKPSALSLGDQVGYWTGDLLVQVLKATAAAGHPITGEGINQTVNAGFSYTPTLDGGVGAQKFPDAENNPTPCAALLQVKNKQYTVVQPFKCYENLPA
jgi:branched-chain amino acid transport system substrate-binding protein